MDRFCLHSVTRASAHSREISGPGLSPGTSSPIEKFFFETVFIRRVHTRDGLIKISRPTNESDVAADSRVKWTNGFRDLQRSI